MKCSMSPLPSKPGVWSTGGGGHARKSRLCCFQDLAEGSAAVIQSPSLCNLLCLLKKLFGAFLVYTPQSSD